MVERRRLKLRTKTIRRLTPGEQEQVVGADNPPQNPPPTWERGHVR